MIYFSDKVGEHWDCVYLTGTAWGAATLPYRTRRSCILYLLRQKRAWPHPSEPIKARQLLLEEILPTAWKEQFIYNYRNAQHLNRRQKLHKAVVTPPRGGTSYIKRAWGYTKIQAINNIRFHYKDAVIVEINPDD